MRRSLLVLSACLLGACGGPAPSPAATPLGPVTLDAPADLAGGAPETLRAVSEEAPTVAFLGDSIAAGLHLEAAEAFPAVLQRRLADEGLAFRLVNAGVSGDTTAGGLARIDWLLAQEPDLVVIELGGNDGLRGMALDAIETNLRAIVQRVRAGGARVLLLGVVLPPSYGPEYTRGFLEIYTRLADELELAFVPYFMKGVGGVPQMNLPDMLHPTPEGHERLADNVLPALREILSAL